MLKSQNRLRHQHHSKKNRKTQENAMQGIFRLGLKMELSDLIFAIEIIGTVAFAFSGTMVAIEQKLDLFGVLVLSIVTAVGGGLIRDLILGIHPPLMFQNSIYAKVAAGVALVMFLVMYFNASFYESRYMALYTSIMNLFDAVGLAAFTVIGINTACNAGFGDRTFLLIAVGMITGCGGGMARDIMAGITPAIFRKHIYASASFAGALVCVYLRPYSVSLSVLLGAIVIVLIRYLAAKYRWNLPKVPHPDV